MKSPMKPIKTFIIRNKKTKEQWTADSGKTCWNGVGHAKAAWKRSVLNVPRHLHKKHFGRNVNQPCFFNDQNEYEVVELKPDNPLEGWKEDVRELFEHYHNSRYNEQSEEFRFEHFWKELYQLLE